MLSMSKRFADYATKSVTGDGISDGFCRNGHTKPRTAGDRFPNDQTE
jgi:hypothetical protein